MGTDNPFDFKLPLSAIFVKYTIFFFNFLAFILGFVLIGTSIRKEFAVLWVVICTRSTLTNSLSVALDYTTDKPFSALWDDNYGSLPIFIGITGIILTLLCFFGCFGALKESWGMLICYGISLLVLCLCILIGGICGYVYIDQVEGVFQSTATHSIINWCPNTMSGWETTQQSLECCGAKSYKDWSETSEVFRLMAMGQIVELNLPKESQRDVPVPDSCCKKHEKHCGLKLEPEINKNGCLESLEGTMEGWVHFLH